jgi:hypothetical protein
VSAREQAQTAITRVLLEKVHQDKYPSTTHMQLIEQTIPQSLVGEYLTILLEKVVTDENPSIPMLRRIQRIASSL